tara:strand:+ start:152 stop:337 length:186 start_codon:yes stop_codon:yes gene_type:complete
MATKKDFKWDGKTRVSNDTYRKNFDEIFKKKVDDPFKKEVKQEDVEKNDKLLKEIADRNGF